MSVRGLDNWKAKVFDFEREDHIRRSEGSATPHYLKVDAGWILFGPVDVRDGKRKYYFSLQQLKCDKVIRVRVGCRYKTLPQAWKHWSKKYPRNQGRQALAIIKLMILQAQAYGLLPRYKVIKFDSSIVRKRK